MDIIIPPPILCVHIKRFKDYGDKITSTVRVDYNIDIKKYAIFYFYIIIYIVLFYKINKIMNVVKILNMLFLV